MSEYIEFAVRVPKDEADSFIARFGKSNVKILGFLLGEEIVRCRDCKHARHYHPLDWRTGKPHETLENWYCSWHCNAEGASEIEPDGFCAWGERRGV